MADGCFLLPIPPSHAALPYLAFCLWLFFQSFNLSTHGRYMMMVMMVMMVIRQYCAGRTPRLLRQLGFPKVEHSNQDFYKLVRENQQPKHDVLVTNPPYSGDHKKRCLEHCRASGKPWFLLVPNYVATKDYYRLAVLGPAAGPGGEPFYVVSQVGRFLDHSLPSFDSIWVYLALPLLSVI